MDYIVDFFPRPDFLPPWTLSLPYPLNFYLSKVKQIPDDSVKNESARTKKN